MADIYSTISLVSYILAGIAFIAALITFFALNVRGTYVELRGQTDKQWVARQQQRPKVTAEKKKNDIKEVPTEVKTLENKTNYTPDGEAVTVLENGEEVTELGLVGVYEPGTDVVTEETTVVGSYEERTTLAEDNYDRLFRVTRKDIRLYCDEIVK